MRTLLPNQRITRSKDFILRDVGGEGLLVPIGARVRDVDGLIVLNETARCVWELLEQDRSLDELATAVTERFDVDYEQARADVRAFLDSIA
jgi:Coenzyme PQQ synthesis protein D (PqqD)